MKYFVAAGETLKLAGSVFAEGQIVEIRGRATAAAFGDKLVPITDEFLLKNLDANAHPYVATAAHRWGRIAYEPGDIIFVNFHGHAKLIADWTRPATGPEVVAWISKHEAAQADRKRGRSINPALVATGGTVKPERRGPGRPPGTGRNQKYIARVTAERAAAAAAANPAKKVRTAAV